MKNKLLGKHKEFKLLNTFSEKKETYTRYFYNCECVQCGEKRTLSQSDANTGICTKCKTQKTINNVIGKTINTYKVLEFSHKKNTLNFYKCECVKCKNISIVNRTLIENNKSCKFCRKHGSEATEQAQINFIVDQYKRGAKQRNLEYDLTEEQFKTLISNNCYYCNSEPKPKKYRNSKTKTKTISYNGIDRINSNIGYNLVNCVSCCEMCNRMKMAYSQKDFLDQVKKIYNNFEKSY